MSSCLYCLSYYNIHVFLWCSECHVIQCFETTVWTHSSGKRVRNNWIMVCNPLPLNPILNYGRGGKQVSKKTPRTFWTLSPLLTPISTIFIALIHLLHIQFWYASCLIEMGTLLLLPYRIMGKWFQRTHAQQDSACWRGWDTWGEKGEARFYSVGKKWEQ